MVDLMEAGSYDCLPWKIPGYTVRKKYNRNPRSTYRRDIPLRRYTARFEYVIPGKGTSFNQGDIIQFYSSYYRKFSWQEWFVPEDDKKGVYKKNKDVPGYAGKQFAIILARYKWRKFKYDKIYSDYGTIVMMLTGKKVGHVRKYYLKTPWNVVAQFPCLPHYLPEEIRPIVEPIFNEIRNELTTEEGRNKYLEILYRKFNPEENIRDRK